jgi:phage-related protein
MRHLSRYRYPYYENPDSPESDIRKLLQKMTGLGWPTGQNPPAAWHIPYLNSHPEWSPLWLVATALHTTPDELLAKIRPGRRKIRDIDELEVLFEFVKEHLAEKGIIRGKDVAALAGSLGLASLSGTDTDSAKERSYLLKRLVKDGYASQIMGAFKGSSHYLPTQKLLEEYALRKRHLAPLPTPIIIPSIAHDSPKIVDEVPIEIETKPLEIMPEKPRPDVGHVGLQPGGRRQPPAPDNTLFKCEDSADLPFDKIAFATRADGSRPAQQEWEKLSPRVKKYFITLFTRICQHGKIDDGKKFKKLSADIWEFKSNTHKLRITCFMHQRAIYLCNIFTKKEDVMPTTKEINLAKKIRTEHINRKNPMRSLRRWPGVRCARHRHILLR